jgi:hypothetical protein
MDTLQPCLHDEGLAKQPSAFALCAALGLFLVLPSPAKADFIDYYAVNNFTLTNVDYFGFAAGTNGSVMSPDGGASAVLTGGDSGTGLGGETDWLIQAPASGSVRFNWSYASIDTPGADWAGYEVVHNTSTTFTQLADTNGQFGVLRTFSVSAGDSFGFVVVTKDNTFGPGILTISNFSAPPGGISSVPEPSTVATALLLAGAMIAVQQRRASANVARGGAA